MKIYLPSPLRRYADGAKEIPVVGVCVREVFLNLKESHPSLFAQLWDEEAGNLKKYLNVFVNDENIRNLQGPDTPVEEGDVLSVIPAIAGGSSR
ncbi:MAG: MoaD/ThiS family protein [Bacillota bacterium]